MNRACMLLLALALTPGCLMARQTRPVAVTAVSIGESTRVGTATNFQMLGFCWHDGGGAYEAARTGGIDHIATVDVYEMNMSWLLGCYYTKTIVHGTPADVAPIARGE